MTSQVKVASLLYHEVVDNPRDSGFQRQSAIPYKHSVTEFARNLAKIDAGPFIPKLVSDIDFSTAGSHLLLTFDDGGKSALHVSDELCKRGWRAHFFITTALLGKQGFLDLNSIRYLQSCGHIIGSHSHSHPDIFKDRSLQDMIEEWKISCEILSQILGTSCSIASVPGGDISPTVLRSADLAGLDYLFTSEPELTPQKQGECLVLGRICLKAGTPLTRLEQLIRLQGWSRQLRLRQIKTAFKTTLQPLYRLYVQRMTRDWSK